MARSRPLPNPPHQDRPGPRRGHLGRPATVDTEMILVGILVPDRQDIVPVLVVPPAIVAFLPALNLRRHGLLRLRHILRSIDGLNAQTSEERLLHHHRSHTGSPAVEASSTTREASTAGAASSLTNTQGTDQH